MGWTRCFYDSDTVADALVSAILQKHPLRRQHALFWAHELWVSEEYDLLLKCLTKAFLQIVPFEGGISVWKQQTFRTCLEFLGYLLAQPAFPTSIPHKSEIDVCTESFSHILKKSSRSRMYLLLERVPFKTGISLLPSEILNNTDTTLLKEARRHGKGLAWILNVCPQPCLPPLTLQWPSRKVGFLSARTFRCTKRKVLFNPSPYSVLTGCAVWQRILKEAGLSFEESHKVEKLVFETVDAENAFYNEYFPEDIPDEWSLAEKEKGHIYQQK